MLRTIVFGLILACFSTSCREEDKGIFVNSRQEKADIVWKKAYSAKVEWLKPCKNEDSRYHNGLVLVCQKKKWAVNGIL